MLCVRVLLVTVNIGGDKMLMVKFVCPSEQEASSIADGLLAKGLVASTQVKEIDSKFGWNNELVLTTEYEVTCFTRRINFSKIVEAVERNHSYEVPQIVGIPIEYANDKFIDWVSKSVE